VLFDQTDAWAFVKTQPEPLAPPLPNDVISSVQHTASTIDLPWQTVDWPFTDIISIHSVVRAVPGEYWAAAHYQVPPGAEGDFHGELLHFADGAWREYPSR
jgi:hypothetical protein